jgi:hypothetical protein
MSLLTSTNSGSESQTYFCKNVGSEAQPIIAGNSNGALRVGPPTINSFVIRGDTGTGDGFLRPGPAAGSSLFIGSSLANPSAITVSDAGTSISGDVVLTGTGSDLAVGGNITLSNGATGKSISGFYSAIVNVNVPATLNFNTAITNPSTLTPGWYMIGVSQPPGANAGNAMPSCVALWSGAIWSAGGGGSVVDNFSINASDNFSTLQIYNNTGVAFASTTVSFAKMANAA